MRLRVVMIASISLAGLSGAARALSAMPNGEGNPYPSVLALIIVFALLIGAYVVVDRYTRRIVERMKNDHDVVRLTKALNNGWLARKAACALGDIRDEKAVEPLLKALHDKDSNVRQAAARALEDIGDDRATGPLRQALGDDFAGVRECATYALQKINRAGTPKI